MAVDTPKTLMDLKRLDVELGEVGRHASLDRLTEPSFRKRRFGCGRRSGGKRRFGGGRRSGCGRRSVGRGRSALDWPAVVDRPGAVLREWRMGSRVVRCGHPCQHFAESCLPLPGRVQEQVRFIGEDPELPSRQRVDRVHGAGASPREHESTHAAPRRGGPASERRTHAVSRSGAHRAGSKPGPTAPIWCDRRHLV